MSLHEVIRRNVLTSLEKGLGLRTVFTNLDGVFDPMERRILAS